MLFKKPAKHARKRMSIFSPFPEQDLNEYTDGSTPDPEDDAESEASFRRYKGRVFQRRQNRKTRIIRALTSLVFLILLAIVMFLFFRPPAGPTSALTGTSQEQTSTLYSGHHTGGGYDGIGAA